jgi:hypothetical protein
MRAFYSLVAFASIFQSCFAEDLLFVSGLTGLEITEATTLGFTTKTVTVAEWNSMITADFAAFKAIIIADNFGNSDPNDIQFLEDTSTVWGPAIKGNIMVFGMCGELL